MRVHTCDPSTKEVEQEDSLDHVVTPYLKHTHNRKGEREGEFTTDPQQANLGEKPSKDASQRIPSSSSYRMSRFIPKILFSFSNMEPRPLYILTKYSATELYSSLARS